VLWYSLEGQTDFPERSGCEIGIIAPKMALSGNRPLSDAPPPPLSPPRDPYRLPWATLLRRVFAIEQHPHPGALAAELCMPKPTVTVYVKRLEAASFLRRDIDAKDLRRHRLTLTPAGRTVLTQGLALLSQAFGARLKRLSAAEQQELKTLLEKMI
jgi:DNA-binding MarR family transcriptional regulator